MTIPAHKVVGDANKPGQIINEVEAWRPPKYLRDVIIAAQERCSEEDRLITPKQAVELLKNSGVSEAFLSGVAPTSPTSAEKRLERLERALLRLCNGADKRLRNGEPSGWWPTEIRKILEEST